MLKSFEQSGISLRFPSDWEITIEHDESAWTATLQSQRSTFLLLTLRPDVVNPGELVEEAYQALLSEYPELDVESTIETLANLPALGHEIDFLTLDTTVHCSTRGIATPAGCLLLMTQVSDFDRELHTPILNAIRLSLTINDDV